MGLFSSIFRKRNKVKNPDGSKTVTITDRHGNVRKTKHRDALYVLCAILSIVYTCWYGFTYFFICAFFKTEPVLWLLNKLGFSETEI